MASKDFILQRICIYAGSKIDPNTDQEVESLLKTKFNISLPQRRTLDEALDSSSSEHEIIDLIKKYRALD